MIYPSYEKFLELSMDYDVVPLSVEIFEDMYTPIQVLKKIKATSSGCYLLESLEDPGRWGRYSYLGFDPISEISCDNGLVRIVGKDTITFNTLEPFDVLREELQKNRSPRLEGQPDFTGGFVGYFAYDYFKYVEPSLQEVFSRESGDKDFDLCLFDKVIAFDHFKKKLVLIVNISTDDCANYQRGEEQLDKIQEMIQSCEVKNDEPLIIDGDFSELYSKDRYCEMVDVCKQHIYDGDVFQVVISNEFSAKATGSLMDTYRLLRTNNPSPYMFYFQSDNIELAGSSPETLIKLKDGIVTTFPLAGTRPRGKSNEEDMRLERELLSDEKELSEHNMLVDLGRNDIGKISKIGSVNVVEYCNTVRFSRVMHIASMVTGEIRDDKDGIDAVNGILPAGTLSGAPKIKACEIIQSLEKRKRGIYGGGIGYLDLTGNVDLCIAIRFAKKKDGIIKVAAGAGIVNDSIAENEYVECKNKAMAIINSAIDSQGGIR